MAKPKASSSASDTAKRLLAETASGWGLQGKSAVLTGATGYLGRALARGLTLAGARVLLTGRRQPALDELADELRALRIDNPAANSPTAKDTARPIATLTVDLDDPEAGGRLVDHCRREFGGLEVLIHNAGSLADALVATLQREDLERVHRLNVDASFSLLKAVLRPMIVARGGSVVMVSSTAAQRPGIGQAAYASSKAALETLARVTAKETANRGVRVNCVAPGLLSGGLARRVLEQAPKQARAAIPMGRPGEAEEVVAVALFLASPLSSYVTGQVWSVDGGFTA